MDFRKGGSGAAAQAIPEPMPYRPPAQMPAWVSNVFLFFFTMRIAVTSPILNMLVNYEATQDGIILEKIHPGSWGILFMGVLLVPTAAARVGGADRKLFNAIVLYLALIGAVIVETIMLGRTGSVGYLLDSLITAGVAGLIVLLMSEQKRLALANIVLIFSVLNCVVSIAEFVLKIHVLPEAAEFSVFRPDGIAGHPLETGLWCVLSFMLLWFVRWTPFWKLTAGLIILVGAASAGARLATAVLFGMAAVGLILPPEDQPLVTGRSLQNMLLLALAGLIAAPFAYFVADQMGLLYRFSELGFFDDSAASRVNVYSIFGMISRQQLLYGLPIEIATDLLFRLTNSKLIESSIAIYVFQFGAIGAAILMSGFVITIVAFLRRANRFLIVLLTGFWIAAGGTLVLSGKSACPTALFSLCIALRKSPRRRPVTDLELALRAPTAWRSLVARHGPSAE